MNDEAQIGWLRRERVDAFVDAAFAFAVTLLAISGDEPPRTLAALREALLTVPSFLASFALIAMFWWAHHSWSRLRSPASEGASLLVSLAIVATVLIYVYPLRTLMGATLHFASGGALPGAALIASWDDLRFLYTVYGVGFALLAGLYVVLFAIAADGRRRDGLDDEKRREARDSAGSWMILVVVGLASAAIAQAAPLAAHWTVASAPGWMYATIPLFMGLYWGVLVPARHRAEAKRR